MARLHKSLKKEIWHIINTNTHIQLHTIYEIEQEWKLYGFYQEFVCTEKLFRNANLQFFNFSAFVFTIFLEHSKY